MSLIHLAAREIHCKIVYYGPGLGGKTTNLECLFDQVAPGQRGELVSLATDGERTLFFDFLPLELDAVRGFRIRLHLYTVPGQVYYHASRRLILQGADGVVFVADSRAERLDANVQSMQDLRENLREQALDPDGVPLAVQYNKRDLEAAIPLHELQDALNPGGAPAFEAVATRGVGVFETLRSVSKQVVSALGS